ncbi:MAG: transporter substrate-binding domain-containing protein, partial [Prevotella sp.]|nr:transporter substrate-binding domain-containing protein [Prevotella sp.]
MKVLSNFLCFTLLSIVLVGCKNDEQRFIPKSLADLRGHTVAANSGTTQEKIARMVTEKENVQCLPGGLDALVALDAGQCDVALVERNNMYSDDFKRLALEEAFTDSTTQEPLACALRKEEDALLMEYTAFFDSIRAC